MPEVSLCGVLVVLSFVEPTEGFMTVEIQTPRLRLRPYTLEGCSC
jgi:hypothetical protein